MSRTYQTTGIILKGMPLGEADRLVSVLTPEYGLLRAVAPGARKSKSRLRGRTELFVVNQLLIVKGRSLAKIIQAETITTNGGLSRHLGKLSASQYLAEFVLSIALSEQPQKELYELLIEHLRRFEQLTESESLSAYLAQAVFHLLVLTGIAPQIYNCCLTHQPLNPNFEINSWRAGFSFEYGGVINLGELAQNPPTTPLTVNHQLTALEVTLLQLLAYKTLPESPQITAQQNHLKVSLEAAWFRIERMLRDYSQYQLGRPLQSAILLDQLIPMEF